ncbi:MAG: hypothetical protein H5T78_28760 [Nocardia sp.]|nr:hypothetical protein [Nocardia sp.]
MSPRSTLQNWGSSSFDSAAYDPATIRDHAAGFAPEVFRARMASTVDDVMATR